MFNFAEHPHLLKRLDITADSVFEVYSCAIDDWVQEEVNRAIRVDTSTSASTFLVRYLGVTKCPRQDDLIKLYITPPARATSHRSLKRKARSPIIGPFPLSPGFNYELGPFTPEHLATSNSDYADFQRYSMEERRQHRLAAEAEAATDAAEEERDRVQQAQVDSVREEMWQIGLEMEQMFPDFTQGSSGSSGSLSSSVFASSSLPALSPLSSSLFTGELAPSSSLPAPSPFPSQFGPAPAAAPLTTMDINTDEAEAASWPEHALLSDMILFFDRRDTEKGEPVQVSFQHVFGNIGYKDRTLQYQTQAWRKSTPAERRAARSRADSVTWKWWRETKSSGWAAIQDSKRKR